MRERREKARGAVLKKRLPDPSETGSGRPGRRQYHLKLQYFASDPLGRMTKALVYRDKHSDISVIIYINI